MMQWFILALIFKGDVGDADADKPATDNVDGIGDDQDGEEDGEDKDKEKKKKKKKKKGEKEEKKVKKPNKALVKQMQQQLEQLKLEEERRRQEEEEKQKALEEAENRRLEKVCISLLVSVRWLLANCQELENSGEFTYMYCTCSVHMQVSCDWIASIERVKIILFWLLLIKILYCS